MSDEIKLQKATFAAGCFWHVEEAFRNVPGVVATAAGYEGGSMVADYLGNRVIDAGNETGVVSATLSLANGNCAC